MKKKTLLLLPITLLCAASLIACGDSDVIESPSKGSTSEVKPDTPTDDTTTHTHSYSNEWSSDQSKHWHASTCGDDTKTDEAEHTYGEWTVITEATETTKGSQKRECSVCGYEETKEIDVLPHTHKYSTNWNNDETNHWHEDTCGHNTKNDDEEHTYGEWIVITPSTEEVKGSQKRVCSVCGYEEIKELELLPHTHKYSTNWCNDETNHWHSDTCGHDTKADEEEHTYGEWDVITKPTLSTGGEQTRSCTVCGYIQTEELAKKDCYTVTFLNCDGSVLATDTITREGQYPIYRAKTPTIDLNDDYIYEYEGWDKEIEIVTGDVTYKAVYKKTYIFNYTVNEDNTVTVTGYNGSNTDVIIPTTIEDKIVTNIGNSAFSSCDKITSITIPNGVTSIGSYAFSNCSSLTSIIIPDSVTSIGDAAFRYCSNLTSIVIPNGVKNIKLKTFYYCSSLTSVTIPNGVTNIEKEAFYGCSNLSNITIPDSVISIGDDAFNSCKQLTNLYYNGTIGDWLNIEFGNQYANPGNNYNCNYFYILDNNGTLEYGNNKYSLLTEVIVPSGITSIQKHVFYGCKSITNVIIPEGVKSIDYYAFAYCSNLKNITLSNTITNIGYGAFYYCTSLTSVTIPDSVTSIGSLAFSSCSSLLSISIPDSVTEIGSLAFNWCNSLKYNEYDNAYYLGNDKNPYLWLVKAKSNISTCIINGNCKYILVETFRCYNTLLSITIPGSVTSIGISAFYECSNLTTLYYNGTISDWLNIEFESPTSNPIHNENCNNFYILDENGSIENEGHKYSLLTDIIIPDDVTSIGYCAFDNCSTLTSITIPNSVTSIGNYAFRGCSNLTSVTLGTNVKSIGSCAFASCENLTNITIPNSVTIIGSYAFENCSNLTNITIPDSITSIGSNAFKECSNLQFNEYDNAYYLGNENNPYLVLVKAKSTSITSCVINENCKLITNAFMDCDKLINILIPEGVSSIGSSAFSNCSSLTSIVIPDSVTSIGGSAFYYCSNLTSITIPDSVTSIGSSAFKYCSNLQYNEYENAYYLGNENNPYLVLVKNKWTNYDTYTINENCKIICNESFESCDKVVTISIPNSVISIGEFAFSRCENLTSIIIGNGVTSIDYCAFDYCSKLKNVYYKGTIEEWNEISIESYCNEYLIEATKYFYSETKQTDTTYNYWHYVNGEPTAW